MLSMSVSLAVDESTNDDLSDPPSASSPITQAKLWVATPTQPVPDHRPSSQAATAKPLLSEGMATAVTRLARVLRLSLRTLDWSCHGMFQLTRFLITLTFACGRELLSLQTSMLLTSTMQRRAVFQLPAVSTATSQLYGLALLECASDASETLSAADLAGRVRFMDSPHKGSLMRRRDGFEPILVNMESLLLLFIDFGCTMTSQSIQSLDECLQIMDGLFGLTNTSIALRSFVDLMEYELLLSADQNAPALSRLTPVDLVKSLVTWGFLQRKTWARRSAEATTEHITSLVLPLDSSYLKDIDDRQMVEEGLHELFGGSNTIASDSDDDASLAVEKDSTQNDVASATPDTFEMPGLALHRRKPFPSSAILNDEQPIKVSKRVEWTVYPPSLPEQVGPQRHRLETPHLIRRMSAFCRHCTAAYGRRFMTLLGIATYAEPSGNHPALDAYGQLHHSRHLIFAKHCRIPLHWILASNSNSPSRTSHLAEDESLGIKPPSIHPPDFFVSLHHGLETVVITVRGTLGLSDLLTNMTCLYEPVWLNGTQHHVHSGMLQQAMWLANDRRFLGILFRALHDWPNYTLTVTGHSLGAGVASLLGLFWSDCVHLADGSQSFQFVTKPGIGLPSGRPIHVYAFSPPCMVSLNLSRQLKGLVTAALHGNDFVSCLNLGSFRDLRKVLCALSEAEKGSDTKINDIILKRMMFGDEPPVAVQRRLSLHSGSVKPEKRRRKCTIGRLPFGFLQTPCSLSASHLHSTRPSFSSAVLANVSDSNQESKIRKSGKVPDLGGHKLTLKDLTAGLRSQMTNEKQFMPGTLYWFHADQVCVPQSYAGRSLTNILRAHHTVSSSGELNNGDAWVETRRILVSRVERVETLFSEITFSPSMMMDHSPGRLEWCLDALDRSI